MITFIVPVYNGEQTIGKCIESILAQPLDKEVIVVDNNSSDTTAEIIQQYSVTYLMEKKRGPAAARNRGLKNMNEEATEYVAFVDSDVVLLEGWLKKAIDILERDDSIGGVGGPGKATQTSYVSRCLDYLLWYPVTEDTKVDSLATMDSCYRYVAVRGRFFDQELTMGEDPEFNFRIIEAGWKLIYSPDLFVYHYHPISFAGLVEKWYRYGQFYALPYLRHPRQITFGFLARFLYVPLLVIFLAGGLFSRVLVAIGFSLILIIPVAYLTTSFKLVPNSLKERLLFTFVHSAKQYSKLAGIWRGILLARKSGG